MKLKNKKTIVAVTAVLLVVVVGVTFAYFQSSASFENLFTAGTYKVVTREVFESPDNWAPGEEIPKTITSTNEGTIPAAVRVSYTEQWLDENDNDITSQVANGTVIINLDNTSDWTNEGNYYYYNYILEPQDTTTSFIKSVTLNPNLNGITCTPSNDGSTQTCTSNNPILGGTYKLTITKETIQADRYQDVWNTDVEITEKPLNTVTILSGTKGNLQPGDMVGIGETEDFYVISSDNSENGKTILFAKYNLLVGRYENMGILDPLTTQGYGLQSELAIGGYGRPEGAATVPFANSSYWLSGNTLLSPYNKNNTIYYFSEDWPHFRNVSDDTEAEVYVYDENSSIYEYINGENGYVNKLISMGAPSTITGRLVTESEAYNMQFIDSYITFNGQDYWTGTAFGTGVDGVQSCCGFGNYNDLTEDTTSGVRPIIEIYTKDIN